LKRNFTTSMKGRQWVLVNSSEGGFRCHFFDAYFDFLLAYSTKRSPYAGCVDPFGATPISWSWFKVRDKGFDVEGRGGSTANMLLDYVSTNTRELIESLAEDWCLRMDKFPETNYGHRCFYFSNLGRPLRLLIITAFIISLSADDYTSGHGTRLRSNKQPRTNLLWFLQW
jgi:hypothetical protein